MAELRGESEVPTAPVPFPLPPSLSQPMEAPSEQPAVSAVPSSHQFSLLSPPEGDSTLRSRIPNSLSLEEAKRIQKEYEAPFKDLIHQNPIKMNDFKRPPVWFQDSPYSHNLRMSVGIFPALLVVLSLSGKPLLGTLSIGALATYFSLNFSIHRHSLVVCLMTVIAAEVANFFSLLPLVWRSFLNAPLLSLSYSFIIGLGGWTLLQFPYLRATEPAMCVLIEELMFVLMPPLLFLLDMWACLFLFDIRYIGTIACLVMSLLAYLYFVPVTSSFYRPGATKFPVVVLTRPMTAILTAGSLLAPCGVELLCSLYSVLVDGETASPLRLVWVFSLQLFLLTLLSKARLFWFLGDYVSTGSPLFYTRAVSGCIALLSGSMVFSRDTFLSSWMVSLPLLLLLTALLAAVVSAAERRSPRLRLLCGLLALLYVLCCTRLPWRLEYVGPQVLWGVEYSLQLFFLTLLSTAVLSALMMCSWRHIPSPLYLLHVCCLLLCEYWLLKEALYSSWMFLGTSGAGLLLTDRLHTRKALKGTAAWISASLYLCKLVWVLPDLSHTDTEFSQTSAVPSILPGFLISLLALGALRFDSQLFGIKRLSYAGIMFLTLLLSQQSLLRPLLSLAHVFSPLPSELLALVLSLYCAFVALLLAQPDQTRGQATKRLLAGVVVLCGGCSVLLNSLKPSIDLTELLTAVRIILGADTGVSPLRERGLLLALSWKLAIDWCLFAIVSFVGINFFLSHVMAWRQRFRFLVPACLLSGWLIGLRLALLLGPFPNALWQIYGISGSITAFLLIRAARASPQQPPSPPDRAAFLLLLATFAIQLLYDIQVHSSDVKCSQFWAVACIAIALSFKLKQQQKKYALGGDETSGLMELATTYYPLIANISCFIAYLSLVFSPFQHEIELTFLFGSSILMLMQNDSFIVSSIRYENMLWPSLAAFDLILHAYYFTEFLLSSNIGWLAMFEFFIICINIPFHYHFINAFKKGDKMPLVSACTMTVPINFILFNLYSFPVSFFIASLACCYILQVVFWHRGTVLEALDAE